MSGRLCLAVLAGIGIGLALSLLTQQPDALAQSEKAPPRWEHKVELFGQGVDRPAEALNRLAAEGWEYVGLLVTHNGVGQVAFKRSRRLEQIQSAPKKTQAPEQ